MISHCQSRLNDERGFTLMELLVVILIIGILSAIAIPEFARQREAAHDAAAKSAIRNAMTQVESCFIANGNYGACNSAGLADYDINIGTGPEQVGVFTVSNVNGAYTIVSRSRTGTEFRFNRSVWNARNRWCSGTSWGCRSGTVPGQTWGSGHW